MATGVTRKQWLELASMVMGVVMLLLATFNMLQGDYPRATFQLVLGIWTLERSD